jgi:PKD repeat protein
MRRTRFDSLRPPKYEPDRMRVADLSWYIAVAVWACAAVVSSSCSRDDAPAASSAAAEKGMKTTTPSPLAAGTLKAGEKVEAHLTPTRASVEDTGGEANDAGYDPVVVRTEADPNTGGTPLTVAFSAEVEGGPPGLRYRWDFGDGSAPTNRLQAEHTYRAAGEYTAIFTVTGPGVQESNEESIDVDEDGFDLEIEADPDVGPAPLTTRFSAVIDEDEPGPFYYSWDFGDGGRDASNPTAHTYRVAGTYTATLTATNAQGQQSTRDVEIQVDPHQDVPETE